MKDGGEILKTVKKMLIAMSVSLFVSAFITSLSPLAPVNGPNEPVHPIIIIEGIIFYSGLICGYVLFLIANSHRKKIIQDDKKARRKQQGKPGVIVFFSSKPAMVVDIIAMVSLLLSIICLFANGFLPIWLQHIIISTAIFTVQMHAFVNGVNFNAAFCNENKKEIKGGTPT